MYFQSFKTKLNSIFLKFLTLRENIFERNSAQVYGILLIMLSKFLQARKQSPIDYTYLTAFSVRLTAYSCCYMENYF